MLEGLNQEYPPFFSFHLRELYLRKNLPFVNHTGNLLTFKVINDEGLHEYLTFLMEHHVEPRIIALYLQSLEVEQQTQMIKVIIEYC
jgi:hypothetical protein